jgi:hypothetical protein
MEKNSTYSVYTVHKLAQYKAAKAHCEALQQSAIHKVHFICRKKNTIKAKLEQRNINPVPKHTSILISICKLRSYIPQRISQSYAYST